MTQDKEIQTLRYLLAENHDEILGTGVIPENHDVWLRELTRRDPMTAAIVARCILTEALQSSVVQHHQREILKELSKTAFKAYLESKPGMRLKDALLTIKDAARRLQTADIGGRRANPAAAQPGES